MRAGKLDLFYLKNCAFSSSMRDARACYMYVFSTVYVILCLTLKVHQEFDLHISCVRGGYRLMFNSNYSYTDRSGFPYGNHCLQKATLFCFSFMF